MKPIYTVLMVLLLAGLGTYVYLYERDPVTPPVGDSGKPKPVIMSLKAPAVKTIEVDRNAPAASVLLSNTGKGWTYVAGAKDPVPADASRVETLLTPLAAWQSADLLDPAFAMSRAPEFGLEPAQLIARFSLNDGKVETIKIGSKTPTSSGYYVLREGDPALYLAFVNVPEALENLINQPPLATPSPPPLKPVGKASPAGH